MKKIILITTQYPYKNGEESLESELKHGVDGAGIYIFAMNASEDEKNVARLLPEGVMASPLFDHKFFASEKIKYVIKTLLSPAFYNETFDLIRRRKISIVNLYKAIWFISHGERVYSKLLKKCSTIIKVDSNDIVLYTYWFTYSTYACIKIKEKYGCRVITRAHDGDIKEQDTNNFYVPLCEYMLHKIDNCFTVSIDACDFAKSRYKVDSVVEVMRLGTRDFGNHIIESRRPFIIASCAIMVPLKRITLLAKAISLITGRKIKWIHFGDGTEYDMVTEICKSIPDNIEYILTGRVPNSFIYEYYKHNDIHLFINISTTEGIPISIMEAMSFGIPALATNVGGTSELVIDNSTGKLLPVEITAEDLSREIINFCDMDSILYDKFREQARDHWQKNFNADENYKKFYEKLITFPNNH